MEKGPKGTISEKTHRIKENLTSNKSKSLTAAAAGITACGVSFYELIYIDSLKNSVSAAVGATIFLGINQKYLWESYKERNKK